MSAILQLGGLALVYAGTADGGQVTGTASSWSDERLRKGLHELVDGWYGGSVVKASLSAGLSRASVSTWSAGVHKPSLAGLTQLCHHAQVDIVELLGGRCVPAPNHDDSAQLQDLSSDEDCGGEFEEVVQAPVVGSTLDRPSAVLRPRPVNLLGRTYVRRSCTVEEIRIALVGAIVESPPPNLTQLAQRLATSARFIMEKWPVLAKELIEASARHQQVLNESKFVEATNSYESAARLLVEQGRPVTPKYLQKVSGLVAFSQNQTRVRAVESVVRKFSGK